MNAATDIRKGRTALAPIIALLLVLADHALRASRRSLPVRAYLLWVLRRAEAATFDHLASVGALELVPRSKRGRLEMIFGGVSVDAALHLAANLKALARALEKWEARMLKREERHRAQDDAFQGLFLGSVSPFRRPESEQAASLSDLDLTSALACRLNAPLGARALLAGVFHDTS